MNSDGENTTRAETTDLMTYSDKTVNQTLRCGDRNSRQKLSITTPEKKSNSARLRWRIFTQYISRTHQIDLSQMTTDKETTDRHLKF